MATEEENTWEGLIEEKTILEDEKDKIVGEAIV